MPNYFRGYIQLTSQKPAPEFHSVAPDIADFIAKTGYPHSAHVFVVKFKFKQYERYCCLSIIFPLRNRIALEEGQIPVAYRFNEMGLLYHVISLYCLNYAKYQLHFIQETTVEKLNRRGEYGTVFFFKEKEGADKFLAELEILEDAYASAPVRIAIPVQKPATDVPVSTRALILQDASLAPLKEPHHLFETVMVEELALLLDQSDEAMHKLAEYVTMPVSMKIPDKKIEKYGNSVVRCVLHYFQCLCHLKKIDTEEALVSLHTHFCKLGLERAADIVKPYLPSNTQDPQEHEEEDIYDDVALPSAMSEYTNKPLSSNPTWYKENQREAVKTNLSQKSVSPLPAFSSSDGRKSNVGKTRNDVGNPCSLKTGTDALQSSYRDPVTDDVATRGGQSQSGENTGEDSDLCSGEQTECNESAQLRPETKKKGKHESGYISGVPDLTGPGEDGDPNSS